MISDIVVRIVTNELIAAGAKKKRLEREEKRRRASYSVDQGIHTYTYLSLNDWPVVSILKSHREDYLQARKKKTISNLNEKNDLSPHSVLCVSFGNLLEWDDDDDDDEKNRTNVFVRRLPEVVAIRRLTEMNMFNFQTVDKRISFWLSRTTHRNMIDELNVSVDQ